MADPVIVDVGGAQLQLPPGATPEAIRNAIANFRTTPEFDKLIDKKRGAPARVRMLVGSAPSQDRLANIQRFYPDAVPYDDDNFVFTDPESGRPTLYNPEGLDLGDMASVAREGAQFAGSALGATFGAGTGLVVGAPTGPGAAITASKGAAIGAGAGGVAATSLFDSAMNVIAGRVDTRRPERVILDSMVEFGSTASGQRLGELAPLAFKRALGAGKAGTRVLVDAFRRLRIEPPAGAATGSRALGTVEKMLEGTPSSSAIMQENAEQVLAQTKQAVDDLAARFGPALDRGPAGETVKRAAARAADVFEETKEKAYTEVFDMIGDDTIIELASVTGLRRRLQQELARAPESLRRSLGPAIQRLQAIETDAAAKGGVAFGAVRQIRTNLGLELDAPVLVGSQSARNDALKLIYGALTEDLSTAAKQAGPEAAKKLAVADRFTRIFMNTSAKTLEKINRFEADERAFDYVASLTKDGAQMLARLRRHFEPEEWDTVAATVLSRMGQARPYAQNATGDAFSVNTFLTNWSKVSPDAKKILFGGKRYQDMAGALDDLTKVIGSLKEMERLTNTSNTGRNMIAWMTMQTLVGGAAGAAAGGDIESVGVGVVGTILAPHAAARLITNPSFVKWLATPVTNPTGISAHLGRLIEIGVAEPEIGEEVDQYIAALRGALAEPAAPNDASPE